MMSIIKANRGPLRARRKIRTPQMVTQSKEQRARADLLPLENMGLDVCLLLHVCC